MSEGHVQSRKHAPYNRYILDAQAKLVPQVKKLASNSLKTYLISELVFNFHCLI